MLVGTPYEGIYTEFKKYRNFNKPQKQNEYEQRDADYENLWCWLR